MSGVITWHVARAARRWALIWGVVFGLWVISTVKAFVSGYPSIGSRLQLAHSLQSFTMLVGPPRHAETVAGFVSWRILLVISVIGAIWGLFTSTGLLRGQEENGQWELLLAGRTTRRGATLEALLGLGLALLGMYLVTASLTLLAGRMPGARFSLGGSLVFSAAMVSGGAMFLGIGALTSQLSATRGQALMLGAVSLGASYLVRMIADSTSSLGWLRWLSPIGWVEELRPLQDTQPLALVPMAALTLVCASLAVILAGRRDLNASVLRERQSFRRPAHWLGGPISLTLRVSGPTLVAWLAGIGGMAAVYGSLARAAASVLSSSSAITAVLGRLGARRASEAYLGVIFLMLAVFIAVMAASRVAALRDEEASGRLDTLLVRPLGRLRWLASRLGVAATLIVLAGVVAGLGAWIGAASQHLGLEMTRLVLAGVNAAVPALVVLGAGVLVYGLRPRLAAAAAYAIVAWSFLVDMLGSLLKNQDWLRDSSVFTHMALAPAANPDWAKAMLMVALGLGAASLGALAFRRRDVEYA